MCLYSILVIGFRERGWGASHLYNNIFIVMFLRCVYKFEFAFVLNNFRSRLPSGAAAVWRIFPVLLVTWHVRALCRTFLQFPACCSPPLLSQKQIWIFQIIEQCFGWVLCFFFALSEQRGASSSARPCTEIYVWEQAIEWKHLTEPVTQA